MTLAEKVASKLISILKMHEARLKDAERLIDNTEMLIRAEEVSRNKTIDDMRKAILSDPSIIEVDTKAELPFKRTTIGEERSMPNGTEIWFLTKEEYEQAKGWVKPKEEEG